MTRAVDQCPFRVPARRCGGLEVAACRLVQAILGSDRPWSPVSRDACERCSRLAAPSPDRPNSVIASLLYHATNQIIGADGVSGSEIGRAIHTQRRVIGHLEVAPSGSQRADTASPVPRALAPSRLFDRQVTVESYTEHLNRGEPFSYLRYGDCEWFSMLGREGKNGDGHDLLPETLGSELRQSLDYVGSLARDKRRVYVGLPITWGHDLIQAYLQNRGLTDKVRWVSAVLFPHGLRDFSTRRFLEAVRDFSGPKYLVANRHLAPVAKGLGCTHVTIPERNCYLEIDRAERACRFRGIGLVLFCASLASECLILRLHRRNPIGTYVDCGHIFDAMVWRPTRPEIKENAHGIMDFLREHYTPMFAATDAG